MSFFISTETFHSPSEKNPLDFLADVIFAENVLGDVHDNVPHPLALLRPRNLDKANCCATVHVLVFLAEDVLDDFHDNVPRPLALLRPRNLDKVNCRATVHVLLNQLLAQPDKQWNLLPQECMKNY